jgi:hypothetical protein
VRHVKAAGQVPLHAVRQGPRGDLVMAGSAFVGGFGGQQLPRWAEGAHAQRGAWPRAYLTALLAMCPHASLLDVTTSLAESCIWQ